jgi:hypothetical protein
MRREGEFRPGVKLSFHNSILDKRKKIKMDEVVQSCNVAIFQCYVAKVGSFNGISPKM